MSDALSIKVKTQDGERCIPLDDICGYGGKFDRPDKTIIRLSDGSQLEIIEEHLDFGVRYKKLRDPSQ